MLTKLTCTVAFHLYYSIHHEGKGAENEAEGLKTSYGSTPKLPGSGFTSDVVWQPGGSNPTRGKGRAKQQQTNTLH